MVFVSVSMEDLRSCLLLTSVSNVKFIIKKKDGSNVSFNSKEAVLLLSLIHIYHISASSVAIERIPARTRLVSFPPCVGSFFL